MRWVLLATVVVLSGCLGGGGADEAPQGDDSGVPPSDAPGASGSAAPGEDGQNARLAPADANGTVPTQVTYRREMHWDSEVAVFINGPTFATGPNTLDFPVYPGAAHLDAEVRWTDAVQDLDLWLTSPYCDDADTVQRVVECFESKMVRDGSNGVYADRDGHTGAPDAPAHVDVGARDLELFGCAEQRGECTWHLTPNNKDAVMDLAFEVAAIVTYPGGVPAAAVTDGAELV